MKIAVSLITYNEENYIRRALESCIGVADVICIVDGCSMDETERVIERFYDEHQKDGIDMVMASVPWPGDFGAQRQRALELVPQDADWWMRIDSDERYADEFKDTRKVLEGLRSDIVAVRIRQTNLIPDESHYAASHGGWETHPRIFRNLRLWDSTPAFRWVGQVHESVQWMTDHGLIAIPEESIVNWNVQAFHYGWLERARREEREDLYATIPGSGITKRGDLTERPYVIREVPCLNT